MPLVEMQAIDADTRYAFWSIEESAQELRGRLRLTEPDLAVLNRLSPGKRTLHWLAVRVLLREMFTPADAVDCRVDEHGKPYLANSARKISFTHSHDYAAAIVSSRGEVGIDLERVQSNVLLIADKFMKPAEMEGVGEASAGDAARMEWLSVCWCAKEAVYKLQGYKGVSLKEHMTIPRFEFRAPGSMAVDLHAPRRTQRFTVGDYLRFREYMLAYTMEF